MLFFYKLCYRLLLIFVIFFIDYNGGRRLLWDKRASRYTAGALLRGGLAHAPRKASARSENQQYHLTEPFYKKDQTNTPPFTKDLG